MLMTTRSLLLAGTESIAAWTDLNSPLPSDATVSCVSASAGMVISNTTRKGTRVMLRYSEASALSVYRCQILREYAQDDTLHFPVLFGCVLCFAHHLG